MSGFSNNSASERKIYANIVNGSFAVRAESKDKPDSMGNLPKERITENKDTKEKKTVYEYLYSELSGTLKKVEVKNVDKIGWQYHLTIGVVASPDVVVNISAGNNYGKSVAVKIPNLKIGDEIALKPYSFEDKEKKDKNGNPRKNIGVVILKDGEKVESYYYKKEGDKGKYINGYPVVDSEESKGYEQEDWKMYGLKVDKFLRNAVLSWISSQEAATVKVPDGAGASVSHVEEGDDDLPF